MSLPTGLADPSGMQQAHYPNAAPRRWLMVAAKTTAAQADKSSVAQRPATEKAPPSSGAKFFQTGLPSCDTRQTHRDNTTAAPHHRKNPAEAGLIANISSLRGFAPVAGKQTRRYITTAGCAAETSQKKPRQRQKKPRQRERGLVGPDCLMRAAAERPNRQRQAHHHNAEPHRWLHSAQRRKSPAAQGSERG